MFLRRPSWALATFLGVDMALRPLDPTRHPAYDPILPQELSTHGWGRQSRNPLAAKVGSAIARMQSWRTPRLAGAGFWFYIVAMVLCVSPFVARLIETIVR
jgi:hypothetical protein